MDRRELGRTGIRVSPIGLGTVKIGRNTGVKYPRAFDLPSDDEVVKLFECAREIGITLLDTAPAYGASESRLGQLLPEPREDWVISTKVGEIYEDNASRFDFSPAHIRRSVETSIHRLRRDVLDLVLIHSDGANETIDRLGPAFDELHQLKNAGLVRAVGISSKTIEGARLGLEHGDVVMVTLNRAETDALPVISEAHQRGAGVLIKKGLSSGHLRPAPSDPWPNQPESPLAEAVRFVFSTPGVTSMVIGTMNPEHLRINVRTYESVVVGL